MDQPFGWYFLTCLHLTFDQTIYAPRECRRPVCSIYYLNPRCLLSQEIIPQNTLRNGGRNLEMPVPCASSSRQQLEDLCTIIYLSAIQSLLLVSHPSHRIASSGIRSRDRRCQTNCQTTAHNIETVCTCPHGQRVTPRNKQGDKDAQADSMFTASLYSSQHCYCNVAVWWSFSDPWSFCWQRSLSGRVIWTFSRVYHVVLKHNAAC